MKLSSLSISILLAFTVSAITSCKDDDPEQVTPAAETCRLVRTKSGPTANSAILSAEHVYNSKGQVTRVNYFNSSNGTPRGYSARFYNAADKVEEIIDYNEDGSIEFLNTYEYNPQGQLIKNTSNYTYASVTYTRVHTYEYNTANQVIRDNTDDPATAEPVDFYTLYEYFPTGNVSTSRTYQKDASGPSYTFERTFEYTYDDKINPYPVRPERWEGKNNITSVTARNPAGNVDPMFSYTQTYTYNSKGYPVELVSTNLNSKQFYEYQCQ